jgi:hypothetical protein
MGSSTKNFVSGSLLLSLLLCGSCLVQPASAASQDSPEGAILDQALKEAAQELGQLKKEQDRAQKQLQRKQRSISGFSPTGRQQQHARIQRQKGRSTELKYIQQMPIRSICWLPRHRSAGL